MKKDAAAQTGESGPDCDEADREGDPSSTSENGERVKAVDVIQPQRKHRPKKAKKRR